MEMEGQKRLLRWKLSNDWISKCRLHSGSTFRGICNWNLQKYILHLLQPAHQIVIWISFWFDKLNQSRNSETAMLSIARMYFLNLVVLSALLLPMFGGLCEKVEKGKHNCLQTQNSDQLIKMEALRIWRIISLLWYVVLPDHQFRTLLFCEILVGALGCHAFNSQRKV